MSRIPRPALSINCPYCGERMKTAHHLTVSPLLKQVDFCCNNPACMAVFSGFIEINTERSAGVNPDTDISHRLKKARKLG